MKKLSWEEVEMLGVYNAEVARGILHTENWIGKMAELQRQFNLIYIASDSGWRKITLGKKLRP